MATTIETDLREVLAKIDNRLERIENDLTEFKAEIAKDMTVLKVDMATVKADLTTVKEDVKDLRSSQRSQIWVLIVTVVGAITALWITVRDSRILSLPYLPFPSCPRRMSKTLY